MCRMAQAVLVASTIGEELAELAAGGNDLTGGGDWRIRGAICNQFPPRPVRHHLRL